jgi:hypothetical protein
VVQGNRYRLKLPTIAVRQSETDRGRVAVTIPEGEIVEIIETPEAAEGMVMVQWNGRGCAVFREDLSERDERVASARLPF